MRMLYVLRRLWSVTAGILWDEASGSYAFTFDFQGVTPPGGPTAQYATQARHMSWDADGWPV
eukprot:gene33136-22266_t